MKFEKFMEHFVVDQNKMQFTYRQEYRTIHFVKLPVSCKVELLYMMITSVVGGSHYGIDIGKNLDFAGIIVDHSHLYSNVLNTGNRPLYFEDAPSITAVDACFDRVYKETTSAAMRLMEGKTRPVLNRQQIQEAKNNAYHAILRSEELQPRFQGLNKSYNMNDAVIDCYTETERWAERIAQRWLTENKATGLEDMAVYEESVRKYQACLEDPEDDIHLFMAMNQAVAAQKRGMVEVDIRQNDGTEKTLWANAAAFANEYNHGYDIIPAIIPLNIAPPPNRQRNMGGISKKTIVTIKDSRNGEVLWNKKDWCKTHKS